MALTKSTQKTPRPPRGNGAREKLQTYFRHSLDTERKVDHLLTWLATEGYAIVPIDNVEPLIGKSHTQNLLN